MDTVIQGIGKHCVRIGKTVYCEVSDHFIPHERNQYRPHVLQHRVLFGYSIILIVLKILVLTLPVTLPSSSLYSSAITAKNIVDLTNQTRINLTIPLLAENPKLVAAALAKAQDMVASQYFDHTSPSGVTPWDWIVKAGYAYLYGGENLAVHYTTAEDLQEGWLASPTHRANIVHPEYTEIGVAVVQGPFEGVDATVVVQMFGRPVSPSLARTTEPTTLPREKAPRIAARVKPEPRAYVVRVAAEDVTNVTATFAAETTFLRQTEQPGVWEGRIAYNPATVATGGEPLAVTITKRDGAVIQEPVALVAPKVPTQQLYTFNEGSDRYTKLFGGFLTVHNLQDSVRRFYFLFMVFLGAALLVNILVKIRIQHRSVISHTMLVIGLALLLTVV